MLQTFHTDVLLGIIMVSMVSWYHSSTKQIGLSDISEEVYSDESI